MDIKAILSKMTLEDKISLCTGADFWRSKKMEQYGIPAFAMSDGPGCNIKRNPLCGRNFEYLSEDPYVAGKWQRRLSRGSRAQAFRPVQSILR